MKIKIDKLIFVSLLFLSIPLINLADKIILKNGRTIQGRIVSSDEVTVRVDVGVSEIDLKQEEIDKIIRETREETFLVKAREALENRDLKSAIEFALKSLEEGKDSKDEVKIVFKEAYSQFKVYAEGEIQAERNIDQAIANIQYLLQLNKNPSVKTLLDGEPAVNELNIFLTTKLAEAYYVRARKFSELSPNTYNSQILNDLKTASTYAPQSSPLFVKIVVTLGRFQERSGLYQDALKNYQIAYEKSTIYSDRLTIKSDIERVQKLISPTAVVYAATPTPRSIFTPIPLIKTIVTPTPTPIPTPTPTFSQKVRQTGSPKKVLSVVKNYSKNIFKYVQQQDILIWIIAIPLIIILNWVIPIKLIKRKVNRGDPIAFKYHSWIKRLGLLPFLIYFVINIKRGAPRKRCPYCNKLIDNIESYSDMNFFICPHCNENITPIYDLKDYIEHLIKNVEMDLSKGKRGMGDSIIERDAMIKLVRAIVTLAYRKRASDLHIEPEMEGIKVRARIDGMLYDLILLPRTISAATVSAIKVMANLDIAEKRIPQDGRTNIWVDKTDIDIRINTSPTPMGEKASLRLLDSQTILVDSAKLGLDGDNLEKFERSIRKSHGVIMVTGPTGCGKSTTLYVALRTINTGEKNIVTIEDPIEYQVKGINQMQVNPAQNFTFATGLRSILRQDPDVIMVGEIRDKETAEIGIDAAMTGHLVFTTLHTIDAPTAFSRLSELGIAPRRYAPALALVMAQRLVRVNCGECKKPYRPSKANLEILGLTNVSKDTIFIYGPGCSACDKTGFWGRIGTFEMLLPDEQLLEVIESGATTSVIREMARKKGMRTLREEGIVKMLQGLTTVEEVIRVTS